MTMRFDGKGFTEEISTTELEEQFAEAVPCETWIDIVEKVKCDREGAVRVTVTCPRDHIKVGTYCTDHLVLMAQGRISCVECWDVRGEVVMRTYLGHSDL